jgi:hypothetical protein
MAAPSWSRRWAASRASRAEWHSALLAGRLWLAYNTGIPITFRVVSPCQREGLRRAPTGGPSGRFSPPQPPPPCWRSPDSQHLLILEPDGWWVTPLDEGAATKVDAEPLGQQGLLEPWPGPYPVAWLQGNRIVFSAHSGDSRNYWAATLSSSNWQISTTSAFDVHAGLEGAGSAVAARTCAWCSRALSRILISGACRWLDWTSRLRPSASARGTLQRTSTPFLVLTAILDLELNRRAVWIWGARSVTGEDEPPLDAAVRGEEQ